MRKQIEQILDKHGDPAQVCENLWVSRELNPKKKVFWFTTSLQNTDISEVGIRRSHSYNKYVIGRLLVFAEESDVFEDGLETLKKS